MCEAYTPFRVDPVSGVTSTMEVHATKLVCEIEIVLYETSCDRGSVHVGIFHD